MATWTIANLERNLADGGVTVAHWRVTESETVGDDTFTASSYGTVGFTPDADASDFVAYDSLTEEVVMGWVHAEVTCGPFSPWDLLLSVRLSTQNSNRRVALR